jgi:phage-related protein
MAGQEIRAGKTYVEITEKGLAATQRKLDQLGKSFNAMGDKAKDAGKTLMGWGMGLLAPMGAAIKSFASMGEQLSILSSRTNLSVDALGEIGLVARHAGMDIEEASAGIEKMQIAISKTKSGGDGSPLQNFLRGLHGQSAEDQFKHILEYISKIPDQADKLKALKDVFGRAGVNFAPMVKEGIGGDIASGHKYGLLMTKAEADAGHKLNNLLGDLWQNIKMIGVKIGYALLPVLTPVIYGFMQWGKSIQDFIANNAGIIVSIGKIAVLITGMGASMWMAGNALKIFGSSFYGLSNVLGAVGGGFLTVAKVISGVFVAVVKTAVGIIRQNVEFIGNAFKGLTAIISGVFSGMKTIFTKVIAPIASTLWSGLSTVASIVSNVVVWAFETTFSGLTTILKTTINNIIDWVQDALKQVGEMVLEIVGAFTTTAATTAIHAVGSLMTALTSLAAGLVVALTLLIPLLAPMALAYGLGQMCKGLRMAKDGVVELGKATKNSLSNFIDTQIDMAKSVWDYIKRDYLPIGNTIKQIFNRLSSDVVDGFNNLVSDISGVWDTLALVFKAGNLEDGVKVGIAALQLEWARFKHWLYKLWTDFIPEWNKTTKQLVSVFIDAFTNVKLFLLNTFNFIGEKVVEMINNLGNRMQPQLDLLEYWENKTGQGEAKAKIDAYTKKLYDEAPRDAMGSVSSENYDKIEAKIAEYSEKVYAEREKERIEHRFKPIPWSPIPVDEKGMRADADTTKAAISGALEIPPTAVNVRQALIDMEAAQVNLKDKQKEAEDAARAALAKQEEAKKKQKEMEDRLSNGLGDVSGKLSSTGTFNAFAARGMGGSKVEVLLDKIERNTKKQKFDFTGLNWAE